MNSSFREHVARLAQVQVDPGVTLPRRIDAMFALRDCGLSLWEAKRTIEDLIDHCVRTVRLPNGADLGILKAQLYACDVTMAVVVPALVHS